MTSALCPSRRGLLGTAVAACWPVVATAQDALRITVAAPSDVLLDYGLFLAGRDVSELRSFDGPHARRDVMELALLMREIRRQLPQASTQFAPIDSYQRALVELRSGHVSVLGTSVWRADLDTLGGRVQASPALLPRGDFVVGLYTAPDNRRALEARTLAAVRRLSVVSNSDWTVDWKTLQAMGLQHMQDVKTWRQMVLSVARRRADVMLAPFPADEDLVLDAEGVRLPAIKGLCVALQGSRHLAVANTAEGHAVARKVFPALAALAGNGSLKRAYRECGFINPYTSLWTVINR